MSYKFWSFSRDAVLDERGSTAVIFALVGIVMIGMAGIAVDFGRAFSARSKLQSAIDSAVFAGVVKPESERVTTAQTVLTVNFGSGGWGTITTTSFSTEADGKFSGTGYATVPMTFTAVLGVQELTVGASAKARPLTGGGSGPPCFNILDPDKWYGLRVRDSFNIDGKVAGSECEVHVHSARDGDSAGFEDSATVVFQRVCLAGSADDPIVNQEDYCAVAPDTFAGTMPSVTVGGCDYNNATYSSANLTLSPGVYCGITTVTNAVTNLTLNPGLYIISGGAFSVSAQNITGTDVTFYFADVNASFSMANANSGTLSAPMSGTYKDILMFQAPGIQPGDLQVNDSNNQTWTGIIHLPGADVNFRNALNWNWTVNLVAWYMRIRDSGDWIVTPHILTGPTVGAALAN